MTANTVPGVEVLGPWLHNKGDSLMLWAVAEQMRGSSVLAVSSTLGMEKLPDEPELRQVRWKPVAEEFAHALRARSLGIFLRKLRATIALTLLPRSLLAARGYISGSDVGVLLDCSGFAYGDVWSDSRLLRRAEYYRKLKRQGTRLIMLPQALGPFETESVRTAARKLFQHFELMYARDEASLRNLRELDMGGKKTRAVPDITHLLNGRSPVDRSKWASRVCIVPNTRMLDKTSHEMRDAYRDFLLFIIKEVRRSRLEPFLLLHETNDVLLARDIQSLAETPVEMVDEDALISKGILGASYAVVSSRYHALISSLSQGIPSLGTSWSHKYDQLFHEYGCPQCLVSPLEPPSSLREKLSIILDPDKRRAMNNHLLMRAEKQKSRVEEMWEEIGSLISEPFSKSS